MAQQESNTKGYVLHEVLFSSNRTLIPVAIQNIVADLEIFEHLDLPYLTGQISFIDDSRLFDRLNIQGYEYITIELSKSTNDETIRKTFVIDKIIKSVKSNEQTEFTAVHLIEDIAYKSNLINVNKAYNGAPNHIIEKVLSQNLNKELKNLCESISQDKIKLIVPNLSPLAAATWVKNRATTRDGLPTYLFSTLANDDIKMIDLGTMLKQNPVNKNTPFLYGLTEHHTELGGFAHAEIYDYSIADNEDMFDLIEKGLVGSRYEFYDTLSGDFKRHDFEVSKDAFNVIEKQLDQEMSYGDFSIDEKQLHKYHSRNMSSIASSGAYDDGTSRFKSYDEEYESSDHTKKIIGRALKHFLLKSSIDIRVNALGFLDKHHTTIGNKVRILFLANRPASGTEMKLDLKKSGDYIIYQCKHTMNLSRYDVHLKCVKVSDYIDDTTLKGA